MNLRPVEALYRMATLKSVTRAAQKLSVTRSAMSSRIASLKAELGMVLLDGGNGQFRLTMAEMRFFGRAQRLLETQRDAKAEMAGGAHPKRVHAVSSISVRSQRMEGGFGLATLSRSAAKRWLKHRELRLLTTDSPLPPVAVFGSYRPDTASHSMEPIVRSALGVIAKTKPASPLTRHARRAPQAAPAQPKATPWEAPRKSMIQSE